MCACIPPWRLLLISFLVTLLSYFPVGYHHAVLNVAHETFQKLINESYRHRYNSGDALTDSHLSAVWSITVSSWQIGALLGSLNAFWSIDRFGRKCTLMLIAGGFQLIGSVFMIMAPPWGYFELLIFGRLLSGISTGLVCPSLRVFLSECSPDRYRGTLNSLAGFVMATAIVSAMALGLPQAWGSGSIGHAQLLLGLCLPFALLQIFLFPLFPDTPKFLYLTRNKRKVAEKSIRFYHGPRVKLEKIFDELERERKLTSDELSFFLALKLKTVRFPLIISMVSGVVYSSVGVDVVDAYSTEMFIELGMPSGQSKLASMLFNVAGLIGAIVSICVVDRLGRRTLLLGTLTMCILCNGVLAGLGLMAKYGVWDGRDCGLAAAWSIAVMTFAYALGPGAVLECLFAEISPHRVRSVAGTVSEVSFWSTNSIYVLLFHPATISIGTCAVLIYTLPLFVCTIFFAFYLPESGQRPVADVAEQMLIGWKRRKVKNENFISSGMISANGSDKNGLIEENRRLLSSAGPVKV